MSAAFGLGTLLLQAAWILAVPPFRGIDEFDHVYRANSVVEGYWRTWEKPEQGRGDLIPVRRAIIEDAEAICRDYDYTGPDNCRPVRDLGDGLASVASAASRYHPAFYWAIGLPSLWMDGSAAVYAMRGLAALASTLMITVFARLVSLWSTSPWPLASFALALTPVLAYSTSLPAPNGLEMLAGAGLWVSLVTLRLRVSSAPRLIVLASLLSAVLVTIRPLGILWFALILAVGVLALGARELVQVLRDHSGLTWTGVVTTLIAMIAAVTWYLSARTHEIDMIEPAEFNRWWVGISQVPVWLGQTIAAFPTRNESAPTIVYALVFFPFVALVSSALIVGNSRTRITLVMAGLLSILAPYAFTVMTVTRHGTVWQGRYTLPFTVGLAILCGFALARSNRKFRLALPLARVLGLGVLAAHVISVANVHLVELRTSPLSGDERWVQAPVPATALLATLGLVLWYIAVFALKQPPTHFARTKETSA